MFDVVMAVVRRKLTGRTYDAADADHIHHVLLRRGLQPWQVLCIIGAMCLTTGAAATTATFFRWDSLAWITAATLIVLMIRLRLFGHYEFGLLKRAVARMFFKGPDEESLDEAAEVLEMQPKEDKRKAA